uniref:C2H2-type domain-containing protein n=1 Tax=Steinernema glaseri TaxID=37863 RepID=A0A1I7YBE4_9BILA
MQPPSSGGWKRLAPSEHNTRRAARSSDTVSCSSFLTPLRAGKYQLCAGLGQSLRHIYSPFFSRFFSARPPSPSRTAAISPGAVSICIFEWNKQYIGTVKSNEYRSRRRPAVSSQIMNAKVAAKEEVPDGDNFLEKSKDVKNTLVGLLESQKELRRKMMNYSDRITRPSLRSEEDEISSVSSVSSEEEPESDNDGVIEEGASHPKTLNYNAPIDPNDPSTSASAVKKKVTVPEVVSDEEEEVNSNEENDEIRHKKTSSKAVVDMLKNREISPEILSDHENEETTSSEEDEISSSSADEDSDYEEEEETSEEGESSYVGSASSEEETAADGEEMPKEGAAHVKPEGKRHSAEDLPERLSIWKCAVCKKEVQGLWMLRRTHIAAHEGFKVFCPVAGCCVNVSHPNFRSHLKTRHNTTQNGLPSRENAALQKQLDHYNEAAISCEKKYFPPSSLVSFVETIGKDGIKAFCKKCGHRCLERQQRRDHVARHLNMKIPCPFRECGYSARVVMMRRHIREEHGRNMAKLEGRERHRLEKGKRKLHDKVDAVMGDYFS